MQLQGVFYQPLRLRPQAELEARRIENRNGNTTWRLNTISAIAKDAA